MDKMDLIQSLQSQNEAERIYAAQDIGDSGDPGLATILLSRLGTEHSVAVKDTVVFQLKRMACPAIHEPLFILFSSPDAYLRNAAVDIFGVSGDDAIAFLTSKLNHSDREIRKLVLDALFFIGTREAILAIRAGLHDTSANVKITAVEYLGRLEDKDSAEEMILLLEATSEPMLKTAILESLPYIANQSEIQKAVSILLPDTDVCRSDPLFLPELLRLTARAADEDTICRIIGCTSDLELYGDDILTAVGKANERYPDILKHDLIMDKMIRLVLCEGATDFARHSAADLVISSGLVPAGYLNDIGAQLVNTDRMITAGIRFLAASGTPEAISSFRSIMESTHDEQLRSLCAELTGPEESR